MEKIGIICEYNPFHNGHLYHLKKIKELYPDSLIILVLGGYFLERGDISLISKWNKTKIALEYGVDIVLELPTLFNTNSADIFAFTSIKLLSTFKIDKLVFGSESSDIKLLSSLADAQKDPNNRENVKKNLKKGLNYPTSLALSLGKNVESNDILGIAYIKAINEIDPSITPITIKRTSKFNDTSSIENVVSAQNIRARLKNNEIVDRFIPNYDKNSINEIDYKKLFELLRYRIITEDNLERFLGVDEGLENRLKKVILKVSTYDSLIESLKTKRYTTARIKRMLIHILLGIEKNHIDSKITLPRVLGFSTKGRTYLRNFEGKYTTKSEHDSLSSIEQKSALIYYDLTLDESIKNEFLNCPIKKESSK